MRGSRSTFPDCGSEGQPAPEAHRPWLGERQGEGVAGRADIASAAAQKMDGIGRSRTKSLSTKLQRERAAKRRARGPPRLAKCNTQRECLDSAQQKAGGRQGLVLHRVRSNQWDAIALVRHNETWVHLQQLRGARRRGRSSAESAEYNLYRQPGGCARLRQFRRGLRFIESFRTGVVSFARP